MVVRFSVGRVPAHVCRCVERGAVGLLRRQGIVRSCDEAAESCGQEAQRGPRRSSGSAGFVPAPDLIAPRIHVLLSV